VLAEYRGLTVAQLAELRHSLGEQATFRVVKNTLTKLAAAEAGMAAQVEGLVSGPSAIAFVKGDVVEAARGLRDFAKANPALVIKGGVIDGKSMSPAEIGRLAELESREVLLAMFAGAVKASMANAAATLAALPVQMARLAGALQAKREAEADGATGQAGTGPASTGQTPTEIPNDEPVADAAAADQDQTEE
jgi:large subunit ribosomal protein L10